MGCHVLLQGTFLTQGSNLCHLWLLHCRQILHHLSYQGSPVVMLIESQVKKGPALLKEATAVRGSPVLSQLTTPGRPGNGRREQKEGDRQPTLTLPPGEKRRAEFE